MIDLGTNSTRLLVADLGPDFKEALHGDRVVARIERHHGPARVRVEQLRERIAS